MLHLFRQIGVSSSATCFNEYKPSLNHYVCHYLGSELDWNIQPNRTQATVTCERTKRQSVMKGLGQYANRPGKN